VIEGVVVLVSYRAAKGKAETARREIEALVATVLASEPECGGITVLVNRADPERIQLIERWPSQDAFTGPHMTRPHIRSFIARAGAFLAGPPDLTFWDATR